MDILLVKLSSLGDVIQTMPVVQDLLRQVPGANIDWVVEEAFAPLVQRVEGLRQVIPMAERRWRKTRFEAATRMERKNFLQQLQSRPYDVVIDFQGLIKSALVARQAKLKPGGFSASYANKSEACGYEWPVRFMVNKPVPMARRVHAVARYRALAAGALGYVVAGLPVYRWVVAPDSVKPGDQHGQNPTIVFAHGTTRPDNEWPQADWIALGQKFTAQGYQVALPQANDAEQLLCNHVAEALGPACSIWPRMPLAPLMDAMASCRGVVGVDSGLSHMAVGLNLPHVQIFSQDRAWRAGPVGQAHQLAVGGAQAPGMDAVWQAWQSVEPPSGQQPPSEPKAPAAVSGPALQPTMEPSSKQAASNA